MVNMSVGDEDLFELEAQLGRGAFECEQISSPGSMTMASPASSSPSIVQLQAKRTDGKGLKNHGGNCRA